MPIGRGGGGFDLAGVDDHDGARIAPGHGPDLAKALEGRDPDRPVVLLAHQPRIIQEASEAGVDLVLSGHTHGGQIWPFSYLVYLQQPYVRGLKRRGDTYLYLSSGTGFWGPPMRLGTTAEIALITLRSEPYHRLFLGLKASSIISLVKCSPASPVVAYRYKSCGIDPLQSRAHQRREGRTHPAEKEPGGSAGPRRCWRPG